ncbi:hypothetical protein DNI29_05835 [Hymenobacter sediminis]|uniref:hypothetical protein n=1 Tax=Hymenobacter sediminis TaxID=2218621 RepID=UPI000F4E86B8|nr:hypothetical protein [Hymenobacter sediminis]RPD50316.1 hypothetical protein DNI29_05835 [Hymenobacter sediminis]
MPATAKITPKVLTKVVSGSSLRATDCGLSKERAHIVSEPATKNVSRATGFVAEARFFTAVRFVVSTSADG